MVTPEEMREAGTRFVRAAKFAEKAMREMADVIAQARRRDDRRRRWAAERAKR